MWGHMTELQCLLLIFGVAWGITVDSTVPLHSCGDAEFASAPPSSRHKMSHLLQSVPLFLEPVGAVKDKKGEYDMI